MLGLGRIALPARGLEAKGKVARGAALRGEAPADCVVAHARGKPEPDMRAAGEAARERGGKPQAPSTVQRLVSSAPARSASGSGANSASSPPLACPPPVSDGPRLVAPCSGSRQRPKRRPMPDSMKATGVTPTYSACGRKSDRHEMNDHTRAPDGQKLALAVPVVVWIVVGMADRGMRLYRFSLAGLSQGGRMHARRNSSVRRMPTERVCVRERRSGYNPRAAGLISANARPERPLGARR